MKQVLIDGYDLSQLERVETVILVGLVNRRKSVKRARNGLWGSVGIPGKLERQRELLRFCEECDRKVF